MKFELFVATRYLRAKRRQAFIGVITGISIAGVAAGVASLIIALAINNGFRQDLQQRLLGSTSHVNLLRIKSDGISNWRPLMERLAKTPHVVAAAPAIYEQVLISRGPRARGAVVKGMIPAYERKVSDLLSSVRIGSAAALEETPADTSTSVDKTAPVQAESSPTSLERVQQRVAAMPPIILGKDMADDLGATVGSIVLVTSPQGELTPFGMVPKYLRFRVVGIFNSGFYDYDSSWAFARLSDAQQLFGLGLGYAVSWAGGHYHLISRSPEVYSIDYVPFAPRGIDGVLVALVSLGVSFIATLYPSWSAARILPAEALRYE